MPEKGWSIITVRDRVRVMLLDKSRRKGLSISDYLEELEKNLRFNAGEPKLRAKRGGIPPHKAQDKRKTVDKSTEDLEKAIETVMKKRRESKKWSPS
jgi:dsDNA-specific endonuclease/ATPase MutS2